MIVSPDKIQCIHYNRLTDGFDITPKTNYSMLNIKSFHIDAGLIKEYEEHEAKMFLGFKK